MPEPTPCADEKARLKEAGEDLAEAGLDYDDAQRAYDDAGGFLDDSSFWDVAAVAGGAAACLSNPFSWVICGVGIVAGGAGVTASEVGRHAEIEAAEQALDRADRKLRSEYSRFYGRYDDALDCLSHQLTKIEIP
jgi:hypothetical protein